MAVVKFADLPDRFAFLKSTAVHWLDRLPVDDPEIPVHPTTLAVLDELSAAQRAQFDRFVATEAARRGFTTVPYFVRELKGAA